jgi:hypothetical protein
MRPFMFVEMRDIASGEPHPAPHEARVARLDAEHNAPEHRLAGSRFAHQSDDPAR